MTMRENITRRSMLATIGSSATTLLAGCPEDTEGPWRMLTFGDVRVEETAGGSRVSFELQKQSQASDEQGTFHDVRVHGYDDDRSEVCTKELGVISEDYYGGDGLQVEMECAGVPTMLTYSAEETPCDDEINTIIDIAVYEEGQWLHDRYSRECSEELPPEPRE